MSSHTLPRLKTFDFTDYDSWRRAPCRSPALVTKLAVELYLAPKQEPDVATLDLPLARLARKWLLRGVLGRNTRKAAERALDEAEQLDLEHVLVRGRQAD